MQIKKEWNNTRESLLRIFFMSLFLACVCILSVPGKSLAQETTDPATDAGSTSVKAYVTGNSENEQENHPEDEEESLQDESKAVVRPMRTFLAIGWIPGMLFAVNGIELGILSLFKEKKDIGACILGVLEGLSGIVLLLNGVQSFLTDIMATYLVGGSVLIYGIFQIAAGVKRFKTSKGKEILAVICGVLSVVVSIIAFTHPKLSMFSVGCMIAFSVLTQGVNMIVLTVKFWKRFF